MKIVDIIECTRPISSDIRNAYIDFSDMTISLVAVVTDILKNGKPIIGYGFNSNGRYGQGGLIRERFAKRLLNAEPASLRCDSEDNFDPQKIWSTLMKNEKPGGHGERSVAVGAIDMAIWDVVAKIADMPLYQYLANLFGVTASKQVFVYAAGGYYYPEKGISALKSEMQSYLDRGFNVVKMKIGGGSLQEDVARIEGVLKVIDGHAKLAVDANGRFDLDTAIRYADMLSNYPIFWYEEPGDPLDYQLQNVLGNYYSGAMATGENLFSHQDARNLLRYGGMRPDRDWLQFDCALSYGLCEYVRILDVVRSSGWTYGRCIPHGGHQMSLNIAAGLGLGGNEVYPDLFQPYGGFPDNVSVENGFITMTELPGIGFEGKTKLYNQLKTLTD